LLSPRRFVGFAFCPYGTVPPDGTDPGGFIFSFLLAHSERERGLCKRLRTLSAGVFSHAAMASPPVGSSFSFWQLIADLTIWTRLLLFQLFSDFFGPQARRLMVFSYMFAWIVFRLPPPPLNQILFVTKILSSVRSFLRV